MMTFKSICWILVSYIWNYPILRSWGLTPEFPVALIAERRQDLEKIVAQIMPYALRVESAAGVPQMRKSLKMVDDQNIAAVFMYWEKSDQDKEKSMEKFTLLEDFAAAPMAEVPVFILSTSMLPDSMLDRVVTLNVAHENEGELDDLLEVMDFIPDTADLKDIYRAIRALDEQDNDKIWLNAAVQFLMPKLKKAGQDRILEELLETADELAESLDSMNFNEENVSSFSDYLLEYIRKDSDFKIVRLPRLGIEQCNAFDAYAYVREKRLFMTVNRFRTIFEKWDGDITINALKSVLKDAEILRGSQKGYSVKMCYITPNGEKKRCGMLCVDMTKVLSTDGKKRLDYIVKRKVR